MIEIVLALLLVTWLVSYSWGYRTASRRWAATMHQTVNTVRKIDAEFYALDAKRVKDVCP